MHRNRISAKANGSKGFQGKVESVIRSSGIAGFVMLTDAMVSHLS